MATTLNPNNKSSSVILSNNNLTMEVRTSAKSVKATEGKVKGKWYWEITAEIATRLYLGIAGEDMHVDNYDGYTLNQVGYYQGSGVGGIWQEGGNLVKKIRSFADGSVVGVALDCDNKIITFYSDGVLAYTGSYANAIDTTKPVYPIVGYPDAAAGITNVRATVNFGATSFKYDIPDGYLSYDGNRILLKSNNKTYSLKPTITNGELTELPNDSLDNFLKYGVSSIEKFNVINTNKNYILQDIVSEDENGLWVQELNRKPLSIKMEGV